MFKNAFLPDIPLRVFIINTGLFMLFREIIAVYSKKKFEIIECIQQEEMQSL